MSDDRNILDRLEDIGKSPGIAGFVRVLTIVLSLGAAAVSSIGAFAAHEVWSTISESAVSLQKINVFLASAAERANERDRRLVAVEQTNAEQGRELADHEHRVTVLEARR